CAKNYYGGAYYYGDYGLDSW
nr:immunoglobulin heavy chain junction region [Macaca mulatta]MOV49135.1 immunoglobulin heavy chain junction region [Macaca mulatta]MOV49604.1 immunoglobulin heavy chain junction region [Macaca mulatta]MOV49669.1 immunoglobulin heavy chain junction region [Macaca mulatta]MOV49825.1 immunoglobulin heavy chain junction region [Macaca mulatta]